mgnify:CR=1 FL=1
MTTHDTDHDEVCAALAKHFPGHGRVNRPSMNMVLRVWFATRSCLLLTIHPAPYGWRCTALVRSPQDGAPWNTDTLSDGVSGPPCTCGDSDSVDAAVAMALKSLQSILQEERQRAECVVRDAKKVLQELNLPPSDIASKGEQ